MKSSKFTESQIVFALKQPERSGGGSLSQAGYQQATFLKTERITPDRRQQIHLETLLLLPEADDIALRK